MRKVYCDKCRKHIANNSKNECVIYDELGKKEYKENKSKKGKGFDYVTLNFDLCDECSLELWDNYREIMEEFENGKDDAEKCAHCGKSLAGMAILTKHITRAGKFCSKECYDAEKKES